MNQKCLVVSKKNLFGENNQRYFQGFKKKENNDFEEIINKKKIFLLRKTGVSPWFSYKSGCLFLSDTTHSKAVCPMLTGICESANTKLILDSQRKSSPIPTPQSQNWSLSTDIKAAKTGIFLSGFVAEFINMSQNNQGNW